ncbi:MAG: hypothetical protein J6E38_05050 [Clostridia bacterium]|nr:hypothetical protein [Clostridia bacterium]
MALYRIADLNIKINHKHDYLTKLCRNYLHENQDAEIDFEVSASPDDYDKDKECLEGYSDGYLESISVYRQIAKKLLEYDGIILHAAVISVDGKAYAFSAPSGTGKSTHIRLWKEAFGDKVKIVNGDKPLIRYIDGKLYAYGTPWCGKEGYNANTKAELYSICFISRAKENSIERIDPNTALPRIFTQLLLPDSEAQTDKFFSMLNVIFDRVKFYSLGCNMDIQAAHVAYEGMKSND